MLVTLKTLQEDTFTVEIDPTQTVKYFKEKIEKIKGDEFPAKNMKLMYAGKFLVDSNKVCDYNVEEKKFVIIVVKKPKTALNAEEPESTSDASRPYMNGRRNSGDQDLVLCAEHEALVQHITELGFTRGEVEAALCASYNNPDRAVEYLINGVLPSSSSNDADSNAPQDSDHVTDASDAQLLRQISMTGPPSPGSASLPNQERIFELFSEAVDECQNRARIVDSLLEEDHDFITQSYAEMEAAARQRSMAGDQACSPIPVEPMPDANVFANNPERIYDVWNDAYLESQAMGFAGNLLDRDHEAIERLKQLGFSDQKVIEAYFVCERNENAAADYLFSQNME